MVALTIEELALLLDLMAERYVDAESMPPTVLSAWTKIKATHDALAKVRRAQNGGA